MSKEFTHIVTYKDREEIGGHYSVCAQFRWVSAFDTAYSIEQARNIKEIILTRKDKKEPTIYEVKVVE